MTLAREERFKMTKLKHHGRI